MAQQRYLIISINMADVKGIDDLQSDYIKTWATTGYQSVIEVVRSELWKIYISSGGDSDNSEIIDDSLNLIRTDNSVKLGDVYIEIRSI
jgi:hypothetical protein